MRFFIVLVTLSLFIWAVSAGVSGVSYPNVKALDEGATDAAALVAEAAPVPTPAGPITAAEEKIDATVKCVEACSGDNALACENTCIYNAYNVPASAGVPTVTATAPGPIATAVSGVAPTSTSGPTTTTKGSGANVLYAGALTAGITTLVASFVSFMV
ncbi:hypothetical protein EMPS_06103 [Entomortierella parvispora]|uniref:Uncharacterized protein n=1 Tax=Entomortierella parvispora TaxID=205924 RepID=A0A9P3HC10_9FUNG|nr:hypothetical protein EMPS_06103 [Entomortierella parvispora]